MTKDKKLTTENKYRDTRNASEVPVSFTQAVISGIAPGGGLYVPEDIPEYSLETIVNLAELPYFRRAAQIYQSFATDLPDDVIERVMEQSYNVNFDTPAICPITSLDDSYHMLELWHGPTSAFKDMALQCLPRVFSACAAQLKEQGKIDTDFMFLVATSGDTGKAALEGFKDVDGVSIGVLFPNAGVSDIQRKQMVTQTGENVYVWGVTGNFDDCQTGAKKVFNDEAFNSTLHSDLHTALTSANSINWGRLMPQIVYYISSYAELVAKGVIAAGDQIDVCVPTGNFGNILAAWYARKMGTPIRRLLCASNENCVLTDFIKTGVYDISDRELSLTPSPSMDILVSSNLERLLYELTDRNGDQVKEWMLQLSQDHKFVVDDETRRRVQELFDSASVSNEVCLRTIKEVFDQHEYLLDPHSAIAYKVAQELKTDLPVLVACTAHWAKFGNNVYRALNDVPADSPLPKDVDLLTGCELNRAIAKETHQSIPMGLDVLDELAIRFDEVIEPNSESIEKAVTEFLSK